MWALLIFLAEYDPWSGAGAYIDEQIIAYYGWSFILHSIILSLSFFCFGRRKLLASIIITITYLLIPLLVWVVGVCIWFISLFQDFFQGIASIFMFTWFIWMVVCITLWLFYTLVNKKEQYSLLHLGDREESSSDLIQFWNKNYIFFLFYIGLVAAFIFFLYASWFMRDS